MISVTVANHALLTAFFLLLPFWGCV